MCCFDCLRLLKMPKRKFDDVLRDAKNLSKAATSAPPAPVKNSLDSDEEDDDINEDHYNVLEEDDIEGKLPSLN